MKILNLILFSNTKEFVILKNTLRPYLIVQKQKYNIDYYFYCFSDIEKSYIEGDMIYIKGEETYVPGILNKTIASFSLFENNEYDYIIRSNVSTIINYKNLIEYLSNNKVDYGGGHILNLKWLDPRCGIVNKKYFNQEYVSGTAIVMSHKAFNYLLGNKDNIDYTIIDDLSIGVLLNKEFKPVLIDGFVVNDVYNKKGIFYRNKRRNRIGDSLCMSDIINQIL